MYDDFCMDAILQKNGMSKIIAKSKTGISPLDQSFALGFYSMEKKQSNQYLAWDFCLLHCYKLFGDCN